MEDTNCKRCNAPNGTLETYGYFDGLVCSECRRELNLLALKDADRAADVDVNKITVAFYLRRRQHRHPSVMFSDVFEGEFDLC